MHMLKSPRKRKSMEKLSVFITPSKGFDCDEVVNNKNEQHTLNKFTVYRIKGQKPKARKIVDQLLPKGNRKVTKIASASGHYYSNIYRLMSSPKKC